MINQVTIVGPQFSTMVRSVQICCEEKGIQYQTSLKLADQPLDIKSPEYLAIHPFGKIPALIHGSTQLFETAAIIRYLDNNFPGINLQPEDTIESAMVDQWSQAISIYIDKAIVRDYLIEFAFPKGENGEIRHDHIKASQKKLFETLGLLDSMLNANTFICGSLFTMADALLMPMLDYLQKLPHGDDLLASYPAVTNYIKQFRQRPSAQNVLLDLN